MTRATVEGSPILLHHFNNCSIMSDQISVIDAILSRSISIQIIYCDKKKNRQCLRAHNELSVPNVESDITFLKNSLTAQFREENRFSNFLYSISYIQPKNAMPILSSQYYSK